MRSEAELLPVLREAARIGWISEAPELLLERCLVFVEVLRRARVRGAIADVGSGVGLPGLCLAIELEDLRPLYLIERSVKKAAFLRNAVAGLGLESVYVIQDDVVACLHDPSFKESMEAVSAWRFAALPVALEVGSGFVKLGGRVVISTSRTALNLARGSSTALEEKLGLVFEDVVEDTGFLVAAFTKVGPCKSGYPRRSIQKMQSDPVFYVKL